MRIKKQSVHLFLFFASTAFSASDHTTRSAMGENWKIISRGTIGTGAIGYSITTPGNYTLSESVTPLSGNSTAIIQINSDDVILDLAGHTLNGTNVTGKGIFVNGKKNVTIKNGHLDAIQNNNIHVAAGSRNVRIEQITLTSPGSTTDIQIDASSTFLQDITISGAGSAGTSINCANSLNDLVFDTIIISNIAGKGMNFGTSCYNVRLRQIEIDTCTGSNNALSLGNGCYDFIIEKFRFSNISSDGVTLGTSCYGIIFNHGTITNCTLSGIVINSDTHGLHLSHLSITSCTNGITATGLQGAIIERCTISKNTGSASYGCKLTTCQNIMIEKSRFFETVGAGSTVTGVWLVTCTNVHCADTQSGGHVGSQAIGFKLDTNCFGCNFENCISRGDFATSTTALQGSFGFHLSATKGCTFTNCLSTSHQGATFSCGFYLNGCSSNSFVECKALHNTVITPAATALAAGFYSIAGAGNSFLQCHSQGQSAGATASAAGYGAAGFYFSNEIQSSVYKCKSLANGATSSHAATALGFYFDAVLNSACKFMEVRECSATSNCSSATSGTTAYGFYDTASATTNLFIDCFAASNSDNATPRVTTNYAANLPIGGTVSANFPRVEAGIDGLLDIANKPLFYNVSITA